MNNLDIKTSMSVLSLLKAGAEIRFGPTLRIFCENGEIVVEALEFGWRQKTLNRQPITQKGLAECFETVEAFCNRPF